LIDSWIHRVSFHLLCLYTAFPKNRTAAASAFETAQNWETGASRTPFDSMYEVNSYGLAPYIAKMCLYVEDVMDTLHIKDPLVAAYTNACALIERFKLAMQREVLANEYASENLNVLFDVLLQLKELLRASYLLESLVVAYVVLLMIRNRRRSLFTMRQFRRFR
jgi:hypothetical protein